MADREVAAFLSSNFRANDPHCCWLLDRQTDPPARLAGGSLGFQGARRERMRRLQAFFSPSYPEK